jgi:hypothetical protein
MLKFTVEIIKGYFSYFFMEDVPIKKWDFVLLEHNLLFMY